jgi:hypothetical protein
LSRIAVQVLVPNPSDFRPLHPGLAVVLEDITVTSFAVDHDPKAPRALGFVIQHGDRKIVITGDRSDHGVLFTPSMLINEAARGAKVTVAAPGYSGLARISFVMYRARMVGSRLLSLICQATIVKPRWPDTILED